MGLPDRPAAPLADVASILRGSAYCISTTNWRCGLDSSGGFDAEADPVAVAHFLTSANQLSLQ